VNVQFYYISAHTKQTNQEKKEGKIRAKVTPIPPKVMNLRILRK